MTERTLPSSGLPRFRLLFLDGDPVSAQEPRRNRVALTEDDGGWDGAQSPLAWRRTEPEPPLSTRNVFPSLEGEPRCSDGAPAASVASPWPELPPAPTPDSAEAVVELRQWERRRRLDREQRGE